MSSSPPEGGAVDFGLFVAERVKLYPCEDAPVLTLTLMRGRRRRRRSNRTPALLLSLSRSGSLVLQR